MTIPTELLDVAGTPVSEWPEELQRQVEGNPELLRVMNEQAQMASLMALKRYEAQGEDARGRLRSRIEERIRNGEARTPPMLDIDALPDWVRMAAAVIVMLGLSVWTHREMMHHDIHADPAGVNVAVGQPFAGQSPDGFSRSLAVGGSGGSGTYPMVESSFQLPTTGDASLSPGILFRNPDPFTTLVSNADPEVPLFFQFSPDLTRQIEASFVERSLMETNRVSTSPLVPVRLDQAP